MLKVTLFVTDMACFPDVVALRKRFFRPPYPADSIVQVSALALPGLLFDGIGRVGRAYRSTRPES